MDWLKSLTRFLLNSGQPSQMESSVSSPLPASSPALLPEHSDRQKLTSFETAVNRVLEHEGGFVDHPSDPGGATNFGITQAVAREHGYKGDMRDLPLTLAKDIYYKSYWLKSHADTLPPALAFQVFDAAVNHGVQRSIVLLQRAAGVEPDGIVGTVTERAIRNQPAPKLVMRYLDERLRFYTSLGTFNTFGRGWTRRVAFNMEHAVEDLWAS